MASCPIALAEKTALVNFVAESLGSFDHGGSEVFAAWGVVNQSSGELAGVVRGRGVLRAYAVSEYDIALARRAAAKWVHGPNNSGN